MVSGRGRAGRPQDRGRVRLDRLDLLPAREFGLSPESIRDFRRRFRTRFEGDLTRMPLYRDVGEGLAPGQSMKAGDAAVGTLVCATADGREGLAVFTSGDYPALAVDGRPCRLAGLNEGLARQP